MFLDWAGQPGAASPNVFYLTRVAGASKGKAEIVWE